MTARAERGLPAAYLATGSSSFEELLAAHQPALLPSGRALPTGGVVEAPHGTTIVAMRCAGGVVMAGDRRATMGTVVAHHEMDKVFAADRSTVIGIAGTAGLAVELCRLFQVELEHFEKVEGTPLSLRGKANRLAGMVRGQLGLAMQGLSVMPLLAGYDEREGIGRIFSYDVTGGCYEDHRHHSIGSGSLFARGALKALWHPDLSPEAAVRVACEVLYDAAEDDTSTGGPDPTRGIWPRVAVVTADGVAFEDDAALAAVVAEVVSRRRERGQR